MSGEAPEYLTATKTSTIATDISPPHIALHFPPIITTALLTCIVLRDILELDKNPGTKGFCSAGHRPGSVSGIQLVIILSQRRL